MRVRGPRAAVALVDVLRADILRCLLAPASRLVLDELKVRYGFGASPLREALMQLVAEGLVDFENNKGFRVRPLALGHFHDISRVRIELDAVAVKWALENGSVAWEIDLVGAFHRLASLKKSSQSTMEREWSLAHRAFHNSLVSGGGSETLLRLTTSVFDHIERYIALAVSLEGTMRDAVEEHEYIMAAALDRNVALTLELLKGHHLRTVATVTRFLLVPQEAIRHT
ncbi:hypothetical protein N185_32465 [Sinorhizobium sp. GW3]|nr:hypothetical protein N185_32465 [Sinorhizobium sp. GW3]